MKERFRHISSCKRQGELELFQDGFAMGSGNHTLGLLFTVSAGALSSIKSSLEYRQIPPDITGEAKIYRVTALQNDASESPLLNASAGKTLRLHGRNLSFDIADSTQGVFLENETDLTRIDTYNRRGSNIVDAVVPSSLAAGTYSISIVTKPGLTYFTANIDSEITVA